MDIDTEIGPLSGDNPEPGFVATYYADLRKGLKNLRDKKNQVTPEEYQGIGQEWLDACRRGNPDTIQIFVDGGMDLNFQDPRTGQSALHAAAGTSARQTLRVLLKADSVDYLLRDSKGRLPSECAYLFSGDVALARLLGNKERKQAQARGVTLTRRP